MYDHCHSNGSEPVCFIPHTSLVDEASLQLLGTRIEVVDLFEYQDETPTFREHALAMELEPFYE